MRNNSVYRDKVYGFSNENLGSYLGLYHFDNARVLSVIVSGDQYFTSILGGAKEVDLYDINSFAWDYFVFKYTAILILSYEEFIDFFIKGKVSNPLVYKRVLSYVPYSVKRELKSMLGQEECINSFLIDGFRNYSNLIGCIPYLEKENYYKLQGLLRERKLPKVYFGSIENLYDKVENINYEVMLASNIFQWLNLPAKEYYELLLKYKAQEIQADYMFAVIDSLCSAKDETLLEAGFTLNYVNNISNITRKDGVYSLIRKL